MESFVHHSVIYAVKIHNSFLFLSSSRDYLDLIFEKQNQRKLSFQALVTSYLDFDRIRSIDLAQTVLKFQ